MFKHPEADESDAETVRQTSPDAFSTFTDFLRVIADPKSYKERLAEFDRREKAALATEQKSKATLAKNDEHTNAANADLEKRAAVVREREEASGTREWHVAEREKRISALEAQWKFVGEGELVIRGIQAPEFTALEKARQFHASREGTTGEPFPADTTVTRQVEAVRIRPASRSAAGA
jgi:hypothetical protein